MALYPEYPHKNIRGYSNAITNSYNGEKESLFALFFKYDKPFIQKKEILLIKGYDFNDTTIHQLSAFNIKKILLYSRQEDMKQGNKQDGFFFQKNYESAIPLPKT